MLCLRFGGGPPHPCMLTLWCGCRLLCWCFSLSLWSAEALVLLMLGGGALPPVVLGGGCCLLLPPARSSSSGHSCPPPVAGLHRWLGAVVVASVRLCHGVLWGDVPLSGGGG